MTKCKLFILMLVTAFSVAACDSDDYGGKLQNPANLMSFDAVGNVPVMAAPDEEVFYTLKVSYSKGLASMAVSLDGELIEGSEATWDDAPTEAEFSFMYLVKGAQFGQTLDFVFTATGVDGYSQSVDYPLWVSANEVEFVVAMPEDLPAEIYSNVSVGCEVNITCGNVLKSLNVTKNGAEFDSKTDFGPTEKTFKYQFAYTPSSEDINKDVTFHFVATDVKDNTAEAYYTVTVHKADVIVKELYSETFNTSMSISGTTALNTAEGGITGGKATEFVPSNIVRYNTLDMQDPEGEEGVMIPRPGAMEGCSVYDEDITAVKYSSDGVDVCLSKYTDASRNYINGGHLWYRKAKNGWFRVDGIKLHGAASLKLTYSQSIAKSKIKVEYSVDNGSTWSELIATDSQNECHEKKFSVPQGSETIALRFTENGGTVHVTIDNIKLVEIQ